MFTVTRSENNPLLVPQSKHPWQSKAVYNGCPIRTPEGEIHLLYRAHAPSDIPGRNFDVSSIGHAVSYDGEHFEKQEQFIAPQEPFDIIGCEDPRVTKIGDTYYIFYTALSEFPLKPHAIKVALATTKDFKTIERRELITPFNAKAMTLFPEKIDGAYYALLTVHSDMPPTKIALARFENLEDIWSQEYWDQWYATLDQHLFQDIKRDGNEQVEIGAPPIKTKEGWLLIYSHITNYFSEDKVFGIEALLLDEHNPNIVIGRTQSPFMVPQEMYEKVGYIPNIIFPSGALLEGGDLEVYYGACDQRICRAKVSVEHLLETMKSETRMKEVKRYQGNPILTSRPENEWEGKLVFNPAAIDLNDSVHILYRSMSQDNTSYIGYARSSDGIRIDERLSDPIYVPRIDYEIKKKPPTGFSGCEDPRVSLINDRIYMTYTAYNGIDVPRAAMTHISKDDFLAQKWNWSEPALITPPGIDDKDVAIFNEKINGKYMILHRINHQVVYDFLDELCVECDQRIQKNTWLFGPRRGMWDGEKVGIAGPPMKTDAGWLLLYHGVSHASVYRVGAILLDGTNPTEIIARTADPIFEPREQYELIGDVPNVVFPCGSVIRGDTLYIYYGGADAVVGVATTSVSKLLSRLQVN